MDYADAGVDVDVEAEASKILYEAAKQTFGNRVGNIGEIVVPFDDFSGIRAVNVGALPKDTFMSMGFDTVGTKVELSQRMDNHRTIAFDLFAMVCDDALIRGGEPVVIGSNLDVTSLGKDRSNLQKIEQLAEGYKAAAKEANVAIINGELCQISSAVGGYSEFAYNWGAAVVWFARKSKMFTGKEIRIDDSIVILREKGFRTNGISLARKIFEKIYGKEWHKAEFESELLGNHVLVPSTIYSNAIVQMHGGFNTEGRCEIHGVAHITGGGIPHKMGRILKPMKYGARLDNLFEPCSALLHCQKLGGVSDEEAYKTWSMGQGLAVITPEPEKVVREAKKFNIDAKIAGNIIPERKISLVSQGIEKNGNRIDFDIKQV